MQAYDNLALEDKSGVDVVFPESAPGPSRSQTKKQTHCLQWVLLGEDLVISPTCEGGGVAGSIPGKKKPIAKGPGGSWDSSSWFLSPNLVPYSKVGILIDNGVPQARFAYAVGKIGLL